MHVMDAIPWVLCHLPMAQVRPEVGQAFATALRGRYLCCSQTVLDEIVAGGVPIADQARLVPNWVATPGSPGRTDYMPEGRLRVVTAGAVSANKGVDVLIRAAAILRDRGRTNFCVDVYGPGTDPQFPSLIRQLDLEPFVRLRGVRTQDQLAALYPGYDVFAFPTWEREPFGFAPMEAGAHGCLMLTSRLCGFSEWFADGVDCVKAERTAAAFADALDGIMTGTVPLAEIAGRGTTTILRRFHLDSLVRTIEQELAEAAAEREDPAGTPADVYRLALLAEKTLHALVQETYAA
jgi:glycosyltransferase involved in cell wall biosynthesis